MKKLLFTSILLFLSLVTNAQKIDGKWVFEKMNFAGYIIYFDDSNKDKENLINAWIRAIGAEDDQDEKNEINKNKDLMYNGLKEMYKSDIQFTDMKYNQYFPNRHVNYNMDIGKLVFTEQGNDGKIGKKEVSFEITRSDYKDDGYNILEIQFPQTFQDVRELKVKLKDNNLVLEKVESTGVIGQFRKIKEKDTFIIYYKKK